MRSQDRTVLPLVEPPRHPYTVLLPNLEHQSRNDCNQFRTGFNLQLVDFGAAEVQFHRFVFLEANHRFSIESVTLGNISIQAGAFKQTMLELGGNYCLSNDHAFWKKGSVLSPRSLDFAYSIDMLVLIQSAMLRDRLKVG